jgi:autotransporter adhesin
VDLERGVYVQRTATVVVNGSKNSSTFATGNKGGSVFAYSYDDLNMNILRNREHKLCDRLQRPTNNNPTSFKDCEIGYWGYNTVGSNDMFIVMNVGEFNSADDVKSWLNENPVTFVYILATPIETPLTETEIAAYKALHTNKGNTVILNDSGTWQSVEYVADTKLYIDNKFAELAKR